MPGRTDTGPSLPPLTQPTGELPRIQPVGGGDDTAVGPGGADDEGVFATPRQTSSGGGAGGQQPSGFRPGSIGGVAGGEPTGQGPGSGVRYDRGDARNPDPAGMSAPSGPARFDSPVPSAIPRADDPFSTAADDRGAVSGLPDAAVFGAATGDVDGDIESIRSNLAAGRSQHAPTNPFPEVPDDLDDPYGSVGRVRSFDDPDATSVAAVRPLAVGVSAAAARQGLGRSGGTAPLDAPTDIGPATWSDQGPSDPVDRLQDTEFKFADGRRKPKPKEPNRLVLAMSVGLVLLAGIAVAWFLTRGDDGDNTETADAEVVAPPEATDEVAAATDPAAAPGTAGRRTDAVLRRSPDRAAPAG